MLRSHPRLTTLLVQSSAVFAQPVIACAWLTLPCWYVAARRARIVVVMHPMHRKFFNLVDGIEWSYLTHTAS